MEADHLALETYLIFAVQSNFHGKSSIAYPLWLLSVVWIRTILCDVNQLLLTVLLCLQLLKI